MGTRTRLLEKFKMFVIFGIVYAKIKRNLNIIIWSTEFVKQFFNKTNANAYSDLRDKCLEETYTTTNRNMPFISYLFSL
jgi:hypothetical protein